MRSARDAFRARGYDGATLSVLAEATGLSRASLYHRFPGGKEEMANAALADVEDQMHATMLAPLRQPGTPADRLQGMIRALDAYYDGGRTGCLLAVLSLDRSGHGLEARLAAGFKDWIAALASLAAEAGVCDPEGRAEDAVAAVQGGLVLAAGLGDPAPFRRALHKLPTLLLV